MADGCEIPGDSDFFGLGVRVGSYLQWFALILAGEVAPGQVVGKTLATLNRLLPELNTTSGTNNLNARPTSQMLFQFSN